MKRSIYRAICFLFAILVVGMCFPFSAFAVDPVSAGVMANAFAQAIAAYGASNGVAMTFDVASTNGIGEAVHDLWKEFRNGTQDADDYATLAAALFPELYYKASAAVGAASDVYTVGYNISSTYAEQFDNFYNWLLSGPAEMVQVDNQYYQFSSAQIGSNAIPISVGTVSGFPGQPFANRVSGLTWESAYNMSFPLYGDTISTRGYYREYSGHAYCFIYYDTTYYLVFACDAESDDTSVQAVQYISTSNTYSGGGTWTMNTRDTNTRLYYTRSSLNSLDGVNPDIPLYSSLSSGLLQISSNIISPIIDNIGVKASTNTGVADFPDTADPNYDALHRAKEIPSSIPWDDALYGDGTGTLTDAQKEAIAEGVDGVIAEDGELTLAGEDAATDEPGTDDPPSTDPDDYQVVGLADLFPFCIPFDIYNFLSALAATPVAPHFTCILNFPAAIGGQQTIDIDFDAPTWNQLAQLLRLLELLAFIVGLALLTRSMFIRG